MTPRRLVYHFTDAVPPTEGARVRTEGVTTYILMSPELATTPEGQEALARELSIQMTRQARAEWLHVGRSGQVGAV